MHVMKTRQIPHPRPAWLAIPALLMALGMWALVPGSDGAATDAEAFEHAAHEVAIDPCALVTADEVAFALGPVGEPIERPGMHVFDGQRTCHIPGADGEHLGVVVGVIDVWPGPYFDMIEDVYGERLEHLENLGDDARWLHQSRLAIVAKGDALVTVQVLDPGGDRVVARNQAIGLVTLAAGRL